MKRWALVLAGMSLGALLAAPLRAGADGDEDKKSAVKEAKAETESPVRRLAELRLDEHVVPARMINLPLPGRTKTLQDLLEKMEEWSKDEKVGGVLLDLGPVALSYADIEELRSGIERLKKADKEVTAFLNAGSDMGYLLACAADEIAVAPTGFVGIPGIGRIFPFMKGYYQMRGVEFDVITAGRFKYPGFMNARQPNQYFQEEFDAILDSWIKDYKGMIAAGRKLSPEAVDAAVDRALFDANEALQHGLVDKLAYYDEYRERLLSRGKMKRYRGDEDSLANVNSIQDFVELINKELEKAQEARKAVGPKIAVLHARGPIIDFSLGAGLASQVISRDDFVKVIEDLRKNDSIKAVVMRVDSPGGSGYASDVIWKRLKALDDEKPLVVSMGTVAGSGGYYIACPARRIFAQPTTITGSIGVLGILQCAWSQFNRMDVELAPMERGARSLLGSPHTELSKEDRELIQTWMNNFYSIFIDRVASTRKLPEERVRQIAEGRIYTGRDALEIGLVDELGGMKEAIAAAREMANIPPSAELRIVHYPRPSSLGEFLGSIGSISMDQGLASVGLGGAASDRGPRGAFAGGPGLGIDRALAAYQYATMAAPALSFDQQALLFSRRPQALCWMAMPEFYLPTPASAAWALPGGAPPLDAPLSRP